jgi:hypothetical protein
MPVIGFMHSASPDPFAHLVRAFRQGLHEWSKQSRPERRVARWPNDTNSAPVWWCFGQQRFEQTGNVAAKPSGGSTSPLEEHADFLLTLIVKQAMAKRGISGSRSAVWRFFERRCISFKKTLYAAEQQRAEVARARRRWMREQGMFHPARLEETCTTTSRVRLRGRCLRGERLIGHARHGQWKTITFVAGLRHRAMVAPFVFEGAQCPCGTRAGSPIPCLQRRLPRALAHAS